MTSTALALIDENEIKTMTKLNPFCDNNELETNMCANEKDSANAENTAGGLRC